LAVILDQGGHCKFCLVDFRQDGFGVVQKYFAGACQ